MAESFIEQRKRELGLTPSSSASVAQTNVAEPKESDFVTQRKMDLGLIKDTRPKNQAPTMQDIQKFGQVSLNPANSQLMQSINEAAKNPPPVTSKEPTMKERYGNDPSRKIPVIGTILKGLDNLGEIPGVEKIGEIGRALYTPGGGGANVAGLTGAAEGLVSKLLPKAAPFAQKAISNAATGIPLGVGQYQAQGGDNTKEALKQGAFGAALGGGGSLTGSALGKTFDNLFSKFKTSKNTPSIQASPILGLPEPRSAILAREAQNRSVLPPNTDVIHGQGNVQTLGLPESQQYNEIQRIKSQQTLGLPEANPQTVADFNRRNGNVLPTNNDPIYGQGNVAEPLGLPKGNYVPPTRLKVSDANQSLDYVMKKIKPEVIGIIQAPARRDLLVNYVQKNTGIPINEIHNMPLKDLQDLGQQIQDNLHGNMQQIAYDVAAKHGHDLPALLEGQAPSLRQQMAQDAQSRVYGVPAEKVNIAKPQFNKEVTGQAAAPRQGLSFKREPKISEVRPSGETHQQMQQRYENQIKEANDRKKISELSKPIIGRAAMPETKIRFNAAGKKEIVGAAKPPVRQTMNEFANAEQPNISAVKPYVAASNGKKDELKFAETARESQNTAPSLAKALEDKPVIGGRTTDVINRKQANDLIAQHGQEGLYAKLMSKTKQFSSSETTAAQILAKQYSSKGGEENLSKAIDLVSKTAKGGREMGQAIQALSQWNKLDQSGALLLGERQLNKGVSDTADWRKLSIAQATPIKEAAQRAEVATETKSLADEVLSIVTSKAEGEALTEAEKATIKRFNDQVKVINDKTKPFLPQEKPNLKVVNKADKVIKEVGDIEPKARTRDQVVSFLDAKAAKARARIAASRNIGFAAVNKGNPVIDYSIIGAAHIANKIVKLSDYSEAMIKDFGNAVKPFINESFHRATNIFRKEQGLPTIEELDRVVRNAIKNERFTAEEANHFKAWASEIGYYADKNMKIEAVQDLQAAMKELGESTLGDKLSTIQTGAQLLNAVTIGRNITGNAALIASEKINKISAVPIDWALSKLTGERTIQFNAKNQESLWKNFIIGRKSGWKGVSPNGTLDSYGVRPNVFGKKNPLRYITKSLGASMQGFDHAAYRQAYGDVLATYGEQMGIAQDLSKAEIKKQMPQLIEKLDQRIFDLADEAGLYATFQDDTLLSQAAEMLKRGLNKVTDFPVQKLGENGMLPKKFSTEGFGLGDVVLKYAKTPANLVMRAIEYSPIGVLRGLMQLAPLAIKGAKFNQFKATRALSRGITGSLGLTGTGYILANVGILTGSASMDKDIRSIQEQSGQGAYKVNWSALSRYITSGLDKEEAKFQKGDHLTDYAWLQPAAISLAMGVNAQKAVNDKKNGADISGWQVLEKGLLGGLQTVLENPMVQGVSSVIDAGTDIVKRQDPTKLMNLGKGVPASFVPTLLNQWRASTDNKQRETFSENLLTEMGNLMLNKVPGLSKKLPVSYDSLGNERERIQGGQASTIKQYLTAFFSPARMTEFEVSPDAKLVIDLMNESGDANVLPRIANKSFHLSQGKHIKDLKVNLDAKQFSRLQQNLGQMVSDKLTQNANFLSNPNISLESKVKKVKGILTDAGAKARENIGTEMGFKKKDVKS